MIRLPALFVLAITLLVTGRVPAQEIDFATQVRPILETRCFQCHGAKRQKGKLRLDRFSDALLQGDEPVLVRGHGEKSTLYQRIILPAGDPDIMPAKGEPLTKDQLATLKAWIDQGASWPVEETASDDPEARWQKLFEIPELTDEQKAAESRALEALAKAGAVAGRIAANTHAVDVNLSLAGDAITDETLKNLDGLEPSLLWLNLSRTAVTDAGLEQLAGFPRLQRLYLAQTGITDAGLTHIKGLKNLRYLNLYGTGISNASLRHLAGLENLRNLYLWQTKTTKEGIARLAEALPDLSIDTGEYAVVKAALAPINAKCPVTGKPVDAAQTVTHEGQLLGFCCPNCVAAFKKGPDAILAKIPEYKRPPKAPINPKCPITGKDVDPAHTVQHEGLVIGLCCPNCVKKFKADLAKHLETK